MSSSVSLAARKLKAESPAEPEVNVQLKLDPADGSAANSEVSPAVERASMDFSTALLEAVSEAGTVPPNVPPVMATESTVAATVSERSMSVTVIEPEVEMVVLVSVREAVSGALVISGPSLVPVMVTATVVVEAAAASEPDAVLLSVSVSV